jgi:hypothetical protein
VNDSDAAVLAAELKVDVALELMIEDSALLEIPNVDVIDVIVELLPSVILAVD